jgi:peptidyl-prolyl cis-trans isomerase SurA
MKIHMKPNLCLTAAVLGAAVLLSCKSTPPANVAAQVNNHSITYAELDKIYKSQYPQQAAGSSEDQMMMQKLDLLSSLINSELLWQRAEKLGLIAKDDEVDTELNKMKAPYTKEEFDRQLAARKLNLDDLKAQLRRDLTIQKLINKEITSKIAITDSDVNNFYNANKASFNLAEPQIHLAQIVTTPSPDSQVRNLKNSKAQTDAEARTKIQDIETRLKRGDDFAMLAQNYSEDPSNAANGGDMGFVPESALEKASPDLRRMVTSLPPGGVSPIIHTQGDYRILRVISKEPAGQRELNDPRVQQSIRETLMNSKDNLLKTAYYEVARNSAKVQNYLARSITDNSGKAK